MNPLHIVDKFFSGRYKLERAHAKDVLRMNKTASTRGGTMQFYAGANPGVNRPHPKAMSSPEDYRQSYERIVLLRAARELEEDYPQVDAVLKDYETYVVGDLAYVPGTGNPEADALIHEYLCEQFENVDYKGMRDLNQLMRLAVRTEKRDGECGAVIYDCDDTIKLDFVSADCIGNPLIGGNVSAYNFNGIRVDECTGAPVIYDLWRRVPHVNSYLFDRSVDANNFLHYFDPFRFDQYHGVSILKNIITTCYDLSQITESCQLNMKYRAAQLPVMMNEQGRPRGSGYGEMKTNSTTGKTEPVSIAMGNGVEQQFVKLGEGFVEFPNDFPNANFLPAYTELTRLIAQGFKLPPEFCFRSDGGGVLTRFHINKAERVFDEDKRRLKRLLRPYKNRLIQKGIDTGRLDLSRFGDLETSQARFAGQWQMGRSVSVDFGREVDGDIKLIEAGLMDPEEHMHDNARSPEHVRAAIKKRATEVIQDAQEVARTTGLETEEVLPYILRKFPNPTYTAAPKTDAPAVVATP